MNNRVLIVRIGEIHLKGLNRSFFINKLCARIKQALKGTRASVKYGDGYIYIREYDDEPLVIEKVTNVFGVQSVSPAIELEKSYETIRSVAITMIKDKTGTFKVRAKRSDKSFSMRSMEISARLGGDILDIRPDLTVNVHDPNFTVRVEIREKAYVFVDTIDGQGGMPLGTNGRACLLLSGGIDSPVAGYQIARRGVSLTAVYFDGFPFTSEKARRKVIDLASKLESYTGSINLYTVPFVTIQRELRKSCPENYATVLMRRFMMRVAERIAIKENALALITGESIGQVASQTLEALAATNAVVNMPVMRPLIGMDKIEIINIARRIGTYELSTLPYEDCCSIFTPKHPATHPKISVCDESESLIDVEALVNDAVSRASVAPRDNATPN